MTSLNPTPPNVAVIGGGPAGLMAAETLAAGGARVDLYEANPSVGRKFLVAGKGGLNLTHAEAREAFLDHYGDRRPDLAQIIDAFDPAAVRAWAAGLGFETFVGSSGHVFPTNMKAAPLLRAWRQRLAASAVTVHVRHRWLGWADDGALRFATPSGERRVTPAAVILALGGGSWPRTGSDGGWVSLLAARGVPVAPLRPANCGFDAAWSDHFRERFAGAPLQTVEIRFEDRPDRPFHGRGACVITATGIEGSLIYAASARLRDAIETAGAATLFLDLAPDRTAAQLAERLRRPRGSRSLSSHVARQAGLKGVKMGLLRELAADADLADPDRLAAAIKRLPLRLLAPRPLAEAISSAGGVPFAALDARLMLAALPGVFCAGEMVDWEAPTGGYLLTACFATGRWAARGALAWLAENRPIPDPGLTRRADRRPCRRGKACPSSVPTKCPPLPQRNAGQDQSRSTCHAERSEASRVPFVGRALRHASSPAS